MTGFKTSEFVERGEQLQADIHDFAERLSTASQAAISATNPSLAGTELGDEWPLSFALNIEQRLAGMATPTPRSVGRVAVAGEQSVIPHAQMFMEDKIGDDTLRQAYDSESPRKSFALDVVGWANMMEQAGWSLLVRMHVSARSRVELAIYEDNDATRAYINWHTDVSNLSLVDRAEGTQPHTHLSERVIVDDPSFAAEVLASQQ